MKLSVGIDSAIASARLWALMLRIRDPSKLHKFWGIRVMNQARANARAKGGRRLWKQIADAIVLNSVSLRGADIRGVGLFGRIGMHKEKGGPIRVREKNWLTIPIDPSAYGMTAAEYAMTHGVRLFRPGRKDSPKRILAYAQDGTLVPVFALCKETASQRADKWLPEHNWVLHAAGDPACACAQAENYEIFTHCSLIFGYGRLYCFSKPEAVLWIRISMKQFYIS